MSRQQRRRTLAVASDAATLAMKVRRSWHRELPLPRGERDGVRGFGSLRKSLSFRTPSSCPSPLWGEGTQRAGRVACLLRTCKQKRGRAERPSMSMIRKSGDRFSERSCSTKIRERQQCWRSRWVSPPTQNGDAQRRRGRPYSQRRERLLRHRRAAARRNACRRPASRASAPDACLAPWHRPAPCARRRHWRPTCRRRRG